MRTEGGSSAVADPGDSKSSPRVLVLRHGAELGGMGRAADFFTPLLESRCRVLAVVSLSAERTGSDRFQASWKAKVLATTAVLRRCAYLLAVRPCDAVYLPISQWGLPLVRDVLLVTLTRVAGCTPVLHLHGAQLPARLARGGILRKALSGAHWIVLSDTVAAELHTSGCRMRSVTVLRNPAPVATAVQRVPGPPGVLRVGWLGTRCQAKGFDLLCGAVARLKAHGSQVEFSAAGLRLDVPESLMACVDHDLGVLRTADVLSFWAAIDVFVLPARWAEGLPFVLLEALQAGCAVAATPSPGCAELFRHACIDDVEAAVDSVTGFLEACRTDLDGVRLRQQKAWRQLRPLYAPEQVEKSFARFWDSTGFGRG
ncbi:glycosyltransferase family 4 protein [Streptomyces sp. NPDC051636]|uniref:glycosyltransferase family 4 protein n=1 Tax=Streptomyces sp. NPDC051636 TaxID=3365663 RepID=UPI0037912B58